MLHARERLHAASGRDGSQQCADGMGVCCAQELVQVESLAQVGVQLLLFTLGLEFSLSKLRAVRSVALLGGHLYYF